MSEPATILVTGGTGQLATSLAHAAPPRGHAVRVVGRPALNFDDPATIDRVFDAVGPALVVNAAAYTAVDAAENDVEAATRANRDAPARLAALCARAAIPLVHVSTDYVYDGRKGAPYVETDSTAPTGVYGATKRDGERAVLDAHDRAVVLRTSWVFSPYGRNFVRTMLNAQLRTATLKVVADQHGSPTGAPDLAEAILAIAARGIGPDEAGIYHAANAGWTTWHGLAVATFEAAARHGRTPPEVVPIRTEDWPTPAMRPADTRLDCGKLARVFGVRLPAWRPAVEATVDRLLATA